MRGRPAPPPTPSSPVQLGLFAAAPSEVEKRIQKLDLDAMTPIEALLALRDLKQMLD